MFPEIGYLAIALVVLSLVLGVALLFLAWRQRRRGANWGGAFLIGLPFAAFGLIGGILALPW